MYYPSKKDTISNLRVEVGNRINANTWEVIVDTNCGFPYYYIYDRVVKTIRWTTFGGKYPVVSQFLEAKFTDSSFPPKSYTAESKTIVFFVPMKDYNTKQSLRGDVSDSALYSWGYEIVKDDLEKNVPAGNFRHCIKIKKSFLQSTNNDSDVVCYSLFTYAPKIGLIEVEQYDRNHKLLNRMELIKYRTQQ
jgi:hypothetical protein